MSASVQSLPGSDGPPRAVWLGLSILAHSLIIGWLIFHVPVAELTSRTESSNASTEPVVAASEDRVQQVAKWTHAEVLAFADKLKIRPDRITKDAWVTQAQSLDPDPED